MGRELSPYEREVRDTVLKSAFGGVAVTALAVTFFSPAGFGGPIGNGVASSLGLDTHAQAAEDPRASLAPYVAPLTQQEIATIRGQIASSSAIVDSNRASTDARLERIRTLAMTDDVVSFAPAPRVAQIAPADDIRLTFSQPASYQDAPVEAYVAASAVAEPISYVSTNASAVMAPHDRDLELADLLLAPELY